MTKTKACDLKRHLEKKQRETIFSLLLLYMADFKNIVATNSSYVANAVKPKHLNGIVIYSHGLLALILLANS